MLRMEPVFVARGDRSYLLTGGLGGFGLALAVWLSQRGARHIILSSKRCAVQLQECPIPMHLRPDTSTALMEAQRCLMLLLLLKTAQCACMHCLVLACCLRLGFALILVSLFLMHP